MKAGPPPAPVVKILKPSVGAKVEGKGVKITGIITSVPGAWKPETVVIVISRDKKGIQEEGSFGVSPEAGKEEGYAFEASLRAPKVRGKYYVKAVAHGAAATEKAESEAFQVEVLR